MTPCNNTIKKNVRREEDFALPCKFIMASRNHVDNSQTDNTRRIKFPPHNTHSQGIAFPVSYPGSSLFLIETRSQTLGSRIQINKERNIAKVWEVPHKKYLFGLLILDAVHVKAWTGGQCFVHHHKNYITI